MKVQHYQVSRKRKSRRGRMIAFRTAVILFVCLIVGGGVYLGLRLWGPLQTSPSSSESGSPQSNPPESADSGDAPAGSSSAADSSSRGGDTSAPANADYSILDDAVFVGNSVIDDLNTYNILPNSDFFARTGLTVTTVMTKSTVKGTVPVIDELNNKKYGKVILMFGLNELGWDYPSVFKEDYGKVIDAVRQRQPDAKIYIQSLLPVSAAASQKNTNNVNNPRIREYNALLKELAQEKKVVYLDVASALQDAQGNLPDEASADGIHPNIAYCHRWVDYIRDSLEQ